MNANPISVGPEGNDGAAILTQLVDDLSPVIDANRDAMGEAWPAAGGLTGLHTDVLGHLSKAAGSDWPEETQVVLLLGARAFDTFTSAMSGTCRGEFDTTQYWH